MPNRSMTGFGQARASTPSATYRVEIRSVNNRYLDIQIRIPKFMAGLETKIKKKLSQSISRGSVSVYISSDQEKEYDFITWDKESVSRYIEILRQIKKNFNLAGDITISDLTNFANLLKSEQISLRESTIWNHLLPVLTAAVENFQKSRQKEAASILKDVKKQTKTISILLDKIKTLAPKRIRQYQQKLSDQISKLISDVSIDRQRIATEVVLMADKLDISEECSRLRAHLEQFSETFSSDEPVGKRMTFLLQEMNREANTIGAKANDATIAHLAIEIKENIEKIREQVQNLE